MQKLPVDNVRFIYKKDESESIDDKTAVYLKKKLAQEFREQLTIGFPTQDDENGLRLLSKQIKEKKVTIKLFLKHQLHAKLYLLYRFDDYYPIIGYLGSSNLTFSGLKKQGELNIDVNDSDSSKKLSLWFEDRWEDRRCIDISDELVDIIDNSWASEKIMPPYHIYLKIAKKLMIRQIIYRYLNKKINLNTYILFSFNKFQISYSSKKYSSDSFNDSFSSKLYFSTKP
ncbi:MAG: phospholipase D-like domain-containing protein [Cyanobacteriota bacterium]